MPPVSFDSAWTPMSRSSWNSSFGSERSTRFWLPDDSTRWRLNGTFICPAQIVKSRR